MKAKHLLYLPGAALLLSAAAPAPTAPRPAVAAKVAVMSKPLPKAPSVHKPVRKPRMHHARSRKARWSHEARVASANRAATEEFLARPDARLQS